MRDSRIYVGKVEEFWRVNNINYSKVYFKVLFDKDEILKYCIELANTKNKNISEYNYSIDIIIYEYSYESYYFDYIDGLVQYFENSIKDYSENMYDKILKCIDCNVYLYDLNGNLIYTEVYPSSCKNSKITFLDFPLSENECNGIYSGKFKYYKDGKINNKLKSKEISYGLKLVYIKYNYKFENSEELFIIRGELKDCINIARNVIIHLTDSDTPIPDALVQLQNEMIKCEAQIYNVDDKKYECIYSVNSINKLMEE